jgi:uncharacterized membrane protein YgaE (UPF0421/DUF939 family)
MHTLFPHTRKVLSLIFHKLLAKLIQTREELRYKLQDDQKTKKDERKELDLLLQKDQKKKY